MNDILCEAEREVKRMTGDGKEAEREVKRMT